jgi:hypothetical protein
MEDNELDFISRWMEELGKVDDIRAVELIITHNSISNRWHSEIRTVQFDRPFQIAVGVNDHDLKGVVDHLAAIENIIASKL